MSYFLKKNQNAPRLSEHPPVRRNCFVNTGIARFIKARVMNIIAGPLPLSFGLDFGRPRHMRHETIFSKRCERTGGHLWNRRPVGAGIRLSELIAGCPRQSKVRVKSLLPLRRSPTAVRYFEMELLIDFTNYSRFRTLQQVPEKPFSAQFSSQIYHVTCMSTRGGTVGS